MENKLQEELANHQNHIINLSSKKKTFPKNSKRSESRKKEKRLEKENKKLQLRVLKLKDELYQLKLASKQGNSQSHHGRNQTETSLKQPTPRKLYQTYREMEGSRMYHSLDRRGRPQLSAEKPKKKHREHRKSYHKQLLKAQNEANEWRSKCQLLGNQYLDEIQKVRLSVEMFKNEVLGTHKDMQMKFIDELVMAHKKFQKVVNSYLTLTRIAY